MADLSLNLTLQYSWKTYLKLAVVLGLMYGAYSYGCHVTYEACAKWVAANCADAISS